MLFRKTRKNWVENENNFYILKVRMWEIFLSVFIIMIDWMILKPAVCILLCECSIFEIILTIEKK